MVEELLQLLVDKVDAELFEGVELEDLEAGNVEDADVVDLLHGGVEEGGVAHVHQVAEHAPEDVLDDGAHAHGARVHVLGLVHPLRANLNQHACHIRYFLYIRICFTSFFLFI